VNLRHVAASLLMKVSLMMGCMRMTSIGLITETSSEPLWYDGLRCSSTDCTLEALPLRRLFSSLFI
jgi:hypothetical protein